MGDASQILQTASAGVKDASGPLFGLAVALLLLTIAVLVVYFLINRTPKDP